MKNKNFFGYKAAVGAFLVIFVNLGVCSTLGIFLTQLAQYSEWPLAAVGYIGTVNTIGNIILSIAAARMLSKHGAKITMLISVIACALHVNFYTFATPGKTILSLLLYYLAGLTASVAITFGTHAACSAVIAQWFIEKREKITGAVLSGAGFGAAIWVFLAGQLFNYFDFKGCYRILSILTLIIGLTAVIFLIRDPEAMKQKPFGYEKSTADSKEAVPVSGVTKAAALKSVSFWLLAAALLCLCMGGSAFMAYGPSWWQANGITATSAANWNALYLVISGIVMLFVGNVFARTGPSFFSIIIVTAFILANILMSVFAADSAAIMLFFIVLIGAIAYPLNASLPSLIGQSVFGSLDFAAISATLMTAVYAGQALYAPVMGIFLNSESGMAGGWKFFAGAGALGLLLLLAAVRMSPADKK